MELSEVDWTVEVTCFGEDRLVIWILLLSMLVEDLDEAIIIASLLGDEDGDVVAMLDKLAFEEQFCRLLFLLLI